MNNNTDTKNECRKPVLLILITSPDPINDDQYNTYLHRNGISAAVAARTFLSAGLRMLRQTDWTVAQMRWEIMNLLPWDDCDDSNELKQTNTDQED